MAIRWNGTAAKLAVAEASADGLLRGALWFVAQHQQRLSVSNPRPYQNSSKPGEYPRTRTGFGRASVRYEPTSRAEIAAEQAVRIGYLSPAGYMAILEVFRRRKGLLDTMKDTRQQLAAIITGGKAP